MAKGLEFMISVLGTPTQGFSQVLRTSGALQNLLEGLESIHRGAWRGA